VVDLGLGDMCADHPRIAFAPRNEAEDARCDAICGEWVSFSCPENLTYILPAVVGTAGVAYGPKNWIQLISIGASLGEFELTPTVSSAFSPGRLLRRRSGSLLRVTGRVN
jgi:hypothetical protein